MHFIPVERVEEVLAAALDPQPVEPPVAPAPETAGTVREGLDEGVHVVDATTPVPDEEPVEVNRSSA
jgi:hypothetical protein